MAAELATNLLYFGDNLEWLRNEGRFPDESVDLVYLDPPFNSNRSYNVLFKESDVRESEAQIHAFEDTWGWGRTGEVEDSYQAFSAYGPEKPRQMLKSLVVALGRNDVTAYLTMMTPRLVELHRVLRPTGSLYLHCDPTAGHYLKIIMDSIFGAQKFVNEIVWKRTTAHNDAGQGARHYGRTHDTILFYSKQPGRNGWTAPYTAHDPGYLASHYRTIDSNGRAFMWGDITGPGGAAKGSPFYEVLGVQGFWRFTKEKMQALVERGDVAIPPKGRVPRIKRYLDEQKGTPVGDVWSDIFPVNSQARERLGYPTQKPLALLERILETSTATGDVVLDPFCGCGTAVHAAQKLGRRWIGIDITPLATELVRQRLQDAFPGLAIPIEGWPVDMSGAISLAGQPDKYHFQDWAVIMAGGRPAGGERRAKKGADKGIDGVIPFLDGKDRPRRGIMSVKAGQTSPAHVRELRGTVGDDPEAEFGVLITLNNATKQMNEAALEAGVWVSEFDAGTYPRMQLLSAQDLIEGKRVKMPQGARTSVYASAERERGGEGVQGRLG